MNHKTLSIVAMVALVATFARAGNEAAPGRASAQFVDVGRGVKLEVMDWGGTGRPLVLLAAIGATAHVYDSFAPKLATKYHVYGITRRGFGASSGPVAGYSADQLGDDVVAVITVLKINRPVLVGHSMSGEELSSVGSRHPEKVAGLIYMEAAYPFAFYNPSVGDLIVDGDELRDRIDRLVTGRGVSDRQRLVAEIQESLPRFEADLTNEKKQIERRPGAPPGAAPPPDDPWPVQAMISGQQKYTSIAAPVLAIFSYPHAVSTRIQGDPKRKARAEADDMAFIDEQIKTVEREAPSAQVVRIPHAAHKIFVSNESDVLHEIDAFIGGLPGI